MAPSQQLKKGKKKADTNPPPHPAEDDDPQPDIQCRHPRLHMAGPDDRFGFKPSSTDTQDPLEASQSIGHSSKKGVGESFERDTREDRRPWDLDEHDESENDTDEQDRNGQPSEDEDGSLHNMQEAPVDRRASHDDEDGNTHMDLDQGDFNSQVLDDDPTQHEATDTFDVLEHHQMKNGRCKAPSPTHLANARSSRKHGSTCPRQASSKSRQCSLSQRDHHPSLERARTSSSSVHLTHGHAPRRAPSEKVALIRVRPEQPPARLSVPRSKYPQHLPRPSAFCNLSPHQRSPTQSTISSSHKLPSSCKRSLSQSLHRHSAHPDLTPSLSRTPSPAPSSSQSYSCSASPVQRTKSQHSGHRATQQGNPSKLGFYPVSWQAFLQEAKVEMRLQAVLPHPLPVHQDVVLLAQEVLDAVLWTYHMRKMKLDNGYFPAFKMPMSRLLCDDLFMFHTELKKIMISIAKQLYGIFSKGNSMHKEWVSAAVAKLLKTSEYLRLPDSSEGKYTNFVSQVLKDACLDFYYGNSKKALKLTDDFQCQIPVNGLILVAAVTKGVLSGFRDSGTDKVPDLTADTCRANFNTLRKSVDKLMHIPKRRAELEEMLREWAKEGMIGEHRNDSDSTGGSEDINIII